MKNINLNLLTVLHALLETGSVSQAAEQIGRTPSAVSTALAQLREILNDPLFIRSGSRLQPTVRAAALSQPVRDIVDAIGTIFEKTEFDPAQSDRAFVIAATDTLVVEAGAPLIRALRQKAPNMSIQFKGLETGLPEDLANRETDFVFLPEIALDSLAPVPLTYEALSTIRLDSVLMCADNPLSHRESLTLPEIYGRPTIAFRPTDAFTKSARSHPMMHLASVVHVTKNLTIPALLEGTDLLAVVTRELAKREVSGRNLTSIPLEPPMILPFGLVWSAMLDRDDAHQWLRGVIKGLFGKN
ncbi:LysR family transcriptional regulator [Rhizobium sp. FKY42]|uniref:LysR family transcriptional regulator n=1 Tax=Rhizobium sp. FKY42 TaxID=2562310 RepID=UPI0010C054D4|nr:LysR family transcriptional regulator [Rhizobium sp. FKY42]